jgi:hypothetical protein
MRTHESRGRRRWPWVLVAAALVGALPLSWLAAHRLAGRTLPPSPWPAPTVPNPASLADNGLDEIVLGYGWAPEPLPDALQDLVGPLAAKDVTTGGAEARARWTAAEAARADVRAYFAEPSTRDARRGELAAIDAALAAPRFADPCSDMQSNCNLVKTITLARIAALANLDAALRGDWVGALTRARALLRAARDFDASGHGFVGATAAAAFANFATSHVRVLLAGLGAARPPAAVRTALLPLLDSLRDVTKPLTSDELDVRRTLLGEHALGRALLRDTLAVATRPTTTADIAQLLLTADAATFTAYDDTWVEALRWLEAPDHATRAAPPIRLHARGSGWWLWNLGGKTMLDLMVIDIGPMVRRLESGRRDLDTSLASLQVELSVLPTMLIFEDVVEAIVGTALAAPAPSPATP